MHTIDTIVIALAVLVFITYRQTRWLPVKLAKLLRMPVILLAVGLLLIPSAASQLPSAWHLGAGDAVIIGAELTLALVAGWLMGRLTEIAELAGVVSSRLGAAGVAVWLGFIAVRVALAVVGTALHAPLSTSPAVILFVVAVIKITQVVVVRERLALHREQQTRLDHSEPADQLTDPSRWR